MAIQAKLKTCSHCGELKRIFKNVTEDGVRKKLCTWCSKLYDANQPKEDKPTESRNSIASRSPKRQKQETQYNKRAKKFKEEHPLCQIGIPGTCTHFTQDVHHEGGKENDLLLKEEWWRAVCRACHDWVGKHPAEAIQLGYSRPRTTNSN